MDAKSLRSDSGLIFWKLFAGFADLAGQLFHADQCQDAISRAHRVVVKLQRTHHPGLAQHLQDHWADRGIPCAARLKAVERAIQLRRKARFVDPEMLRDHREIGAAGIQHFHQKVFDFDVIVSTRQA